MWNCMIIYQTWWSLIKGICGTTCRYFNNISCVFLQNHISLDKRWESKKHPNRLFKNKIKMLTLHLISPTPHPLEDQKNIYKNKQTNKQTLYQTQKTPYIPKEKNKTRHSQPLLKIFTFSIYSPLCLHWKSVTFNFLRKHGTDLRHMDKKINVFGCFEYIYYYKIN